MTRRWTLRVASLVVAGIAGCSNPPPRVDPPGAIGTDATPKANSVMLPTMTGATRKISGTAPVFPAELRSSGRTYVVSAKICVSNAGEVDGVSILAGNESALVTNVVNAVKDWRYIPLTVNGGAAIPFCYVAKFEFKAI